MPYFCIVQSVNLIVIKVKQMTKIHFTKMHGAGNDYIYVYTPDNMISDPSAVSIQLSRPHFAIGSDGLILISKSDVADFHMHIFNNDGSEALMCGNGVRCVAKYVWDHKLTTKTSVAIDTLSGIKQIDLRLEDGKCTGATVNMGAPRDIENRTVAGWDGTYVSMGNPHFVIFVPDVMSVDVAIEGKALEFNEAFPNRCNIEFATVMPDGTIRMRVWERGSGITLACGTGACATAVAAAYTGRRGRSSDIEMDGGTLHIEWSEADDAVMMTGPAETAFEGEVEIEQ